MKSGVLWPVQAVGGGLGRAYWKRHKEGVPKKEKSPQAQIGGRSILDETRRVVERFAPVRLPFLSSRRQPFLHFPLLLVPLLRCSRWIALRPPRAARWPRKQVGDFAEAEMEKRRLCLRRHTAYSLVPTSRFAFYITFILLHFSRDKCLRGFASRLGKCFHNVLLRRSLLVPPHLARLRREPLVSFFPRTRNRGIK